MTAMTTTYYVIVFVIRPNGHSYEVLLGRRAEGRYLGGTWQLITGSIEPNETAWQAGVREVREETGLEIGAMYRVSHLTQFYRPDIDSICVAPMFAAFVEASVEPTINPEHTHLEWVSIDAAAERLTWPGDLTALEQIRQFILADHPIKPHLRVPLG
ncbi:MAG: hydrolase [Phycisphaerales bacterium]|nr:hydrolase [Phycisphaerales bacterium]